MRNRLFPALVSIISWFAASAAGAERPNILLLFADDLGRYASAYADSDRPSVNDAIHTPVFDSVPRQGALFRNAFVSAPSCTPSRASLYTGRHFFRNGSHSQLHSPCPDDTPDPFDEVIGMPNLLARAGYHVGWSYKWHMRANLIGGNENNYRAHGSDFNRFSQTVMARGDMEQAKQELIEEARRNFQDFLERRQPGQPFFFSFIPTNTHRDWVQGSGQRLWGVDPDDLKGKMPPFLPDNETIREDFADYLGEAMAFDAACGALIDGQSLLPALQAERPAQLLRGWALIGREAHVEVSRPGGLPYPTRALRTPDFLYLINFKPDRWPVAEPPLDGIYEPAMRNGRRRMDIDFGPTRDWFTDHADQLQGSAHWRLGFAKRPRIELYDLRDDPHQINNVARIEKYQNINDTLHQQLMAELQAKNDPRLQDDAFDFLPFNLQEGIE